MQILLTVNKANRKLLIFITEAFNTLDSRDFKGSETQSTLGCFIIFYIDISLGLVQFFTGVMGAAKGHISALQCQS